MWVEYSCCKIAGLHPQIACLSRGFCVDSTHVAVQVNSPFLVDLVSPVILEKAVGAAGKRFACYDSSSFHHVSSCFFEISRAVLGRRLLSTQWNGSYCCVPWNPRNCLSQMSVLILLSFNSLLAFSGTLISSESLVRQKGQVKVGVKMG